MSLVFSDQSGSLVPPHCHLKSLTLEATIEQLPLDNFCVPTTALSQDVAEELKQNPARAGVILTDHGEFFGMISRRRFWEQMGRPYSLELFSKRSILHLYGFIQQDGLRLPGSSPIVRAAWLALQRRPELLYEPIIVDLASNHYGLLDSHYLLMADSQIHQLTIQLLRESSQQLATANQQLQRLATLDGLTGISNRRQFDESLLSLWFQGSQTGKPMTLLMLDVDFFKRYNDHYGHLAGDDALRKVAQGLEMAMAMNLPLGVVARYGGEEFAILLPGCDRPQGEGFAQKVQDQIHSLKLSFPDSPVGDGITLSIGGATLIPNAHRAPQDLIAAADRALYGAKEAGRDRWLFAD
ncbi:diguanylate cyclase [Spirulina sp. CCNP1310]|uniref:diguanylate cyclase domain-containing protein n=1 Tax=Spirulina sp. CCNP1310 TaxID=3110249 RepID=UPI002B1EDEFF|nr:diguanylate cyclase [Spirulina sp. CCNP1310]MEA5419269.1 diguanylate cyclase [Spirulina sp. CCNP1310]